MEPDDKSVPWKWTQEQLAGQSDLVKKLMDDLDKLCEEVRGINFALKMLRNSMAKYPVIR